MPNVPSSSLTKVLACAVRFGSSQKKKAILIKRKKNAFEKQGIKLIKIPPTLGVRFNIYLAVFRNIFRVGCYCRKYDRFGK